VESHREGKQLKIKMKPGLFILILVLTTSDFPKAQGQSSSSPDWESQQITNSLINRENRVKDVIVQILPKVNSLITDVTNTAVNSTLVQLRDFLQLISTTSNYGGQTSILTCNDITAKIASINYDIQTCYNIKFTVDVNNTLLFVQANNVNIYFIANYYSPTVTDKNRQEISSLVASLLVLVDEYIQYSLALVTAIVGYTRLYFNLIIYKQNYCSCPVPLSTSASSVLALVDSNLQRINSAVVGVETSLQSASTDVAIKIATVNPVLKMNSLLILLTTTLDTLTLACSGIKKLSTNDVINSTTTCDGAALKVAFVEFKLNQYFSTNFGAIKNVTFVLAYLNTMNAYLPYLSGDQTNTPVRNQFGANIG
jgi:hypothetical protein